MLMLNVYNTAFEQGTKAMSMYQNEIKTNWMVKTNNYLINCKKVIHLRSRIPFVFFMAEIKNTI